MLKLPLKLLYPIFCIKFVCSSMDCSAITTDNKLTDCYLEQLKISDENTKVIEIKEICKKKVAGNVPQMTPFDKRLLREKETRNNPSVITPHRLNYMLPISYMTNPNAELGNLLLDQDGELDNLEAKFQISFKAPISEHLFNQNDAVFFAFTIQSYWQLYNTDISSPFRETNYQPEVLYWYENDYSIGDWTNKVIMVGLQHQSNGRSELLSRSWNRIFANFVWEKENWVLSFNPWYRIPEGKKQDPLQARGDDNPDIEKFMGNFEFRSIYKWEEQTFSLMFRNNLRSDNKGAIELGWTFPMGRRFKGYAQFFSGYGESLIDYNKNVNRIGIGILLTDYF